MEAIHNPHPYGSPAYYAIDARNRLAEKQNSLVGVIAKKAYYSQVEYNAALIAYRKRKAGK